MYRHRAVCWMLAEVKIKYIIRCDVHMYMCVVNNVSRFRFGWLVSKRLHKTYILLHIVSVDRLAILSPSPSLHCHPNIFIRSVRPFVRSPVRPASVSQSFNHLPFYRRHLELDSTTPLMPLHNTLRPQHIQEVMDKIISSSYNKHKSQAKNEEEK